MKATSREYTTVRVVLTDTTCGEACWQAREDVCRCSCNGRNHGVLREGATERPVRQSRIDGYRYVLAAVGRYEDLAVEAARINGGYHYLAHEAGAVARLRAATRSEAARWPELSAFSDLAPSDWSYQYPALLWIRAGCQAFMAQRL